MSRVDRTAFTLVELLVVSAIVAVLVALILPAVQAARAAANRMSCANNLKQLGLAALQYHDGHRVLPPGYQSGAVAPRMAQASWLVLVLPYLEQSALYAAAQADYRRSANPFRPAHAGLATVVPAFLCPADPYSAVVQTSKISRHRIAFTDYLGNAGKDLYSKDGVLFRDSQVRLADISDGTSQTLLAGERPPSRDYQFGWWYAGRGQRGTGSLDMVLGAREQNVLPVARGSCASGAYEYGPGAFDDSCARFHFWSHHPGGAQFVFADGAVRLLSYAAAPLLPALASRAGGEAASLPD